MMDAEMQKKIQELQILEQHLQAFQMEKQAVQAESQEVSNALLELKKTNQDVFKILSGIMLKADKESLIKDLEGRKKLLDLRISAVEKQENLVDNKASVLRAEINNSIGKQKN